MEAFLISHQFNTDLKLITSTCEIIYQTFFILSMRGSLAPKTNSQLNPTFLLTSTIKLETCYQRRVPE